MKYNKLKADINLQMEIKPVKTVLGNVVQEYHLQLVPEPKLLTKRLYS